MKTRILPTLALLALAVVPLGAAGPHALALPLAASPEVAHAAIAASTTGLNVTTRTIWYDVRGGSDDELAKQVQALGPRDGAGAWGASTAWSFTWSFVAAPDAGGCRVAEPRVDLTLTFTYPRWTPSTDAEPELVARWQGYLEAATLHEQGHAGLATDAGTSLVAALRQAPASATCDGLEEVTDRVAERVLAQHALRQALYDVQTDHGQTQGAKFP